jgi:hypothetical protein
MRLDEKYRRKLLGIFPNASLKYGLTDVLKFETISDASLPPGVKKEIWLSGSARDRLSVGNRVFASAGISQAPSACSMKAVYNLAWPELRDPESQWQPRSSGRS